MDEGFKVLIADDEYWTREKLRKMIEWEEYGLTLMPMAGDGEEVLARMEQEKPDIESEGGDSGKEPDNLRSDKKVLNGGGNKIKGAGGQPFGEYQTGGLPCSIV